MRLLSLGMGLAAAALVARLAFVQVLDGARYTSYAVNEVEQTVALNAPRGAVYDSTGDLLAVSAPRYDVLSDDFLVKDPAQAASELAPVLGVGEGQLRAELSEQSGYVVLARQVDAAEQAGALALGLPGVTTQPDARRVEPEGPLFEPLLGGVNAAGHGDAGIEYAEDGQLTGTPGSEIVAEAPGGVVLPAGAREVVAPHPGRSIVLTLDEPLQLEVTNDVEAQMRATKADSGIAVVEDVKTGAIRAMVALCLSGTPSCGYEGPKGSIGPAVSESALTSIYQPGSVMKLATVSFSLQDHLISPDTTFTVPYALSIGGYTFEDADYHPTEQLPVSQILAQSSNIGTIEISRLLGLDRLSAAFHALGFGRPTGLDWPGESPGILGTPSQWYGSAAGSVPIGTGVAVTPMQVLDAYNTVANDGVFVPPELVAGTMGPDGALVPAHTGPTRRVLLPSTISALVPMLQLVVQDGTAVAACIPGYDVAGKTGTAQVPDSDGLGYVPGDWNATFVGFVPAEHPVLSGIVVLNHPTPIYGGTVAAPVFAQFMGYALQHFDIAPPTRSSGSAPGCSGATGPA